MDKVSIILIFFLIGVQGMAQKNIWTPDNGNGTFTNPLMWGDWPDPDVIRVGDEFYFISTSMHYLPGCPIAKSRDLVNWEMAGYAVNRYEEDERFDMHNGTMYLNGSWASTIRHHNGKFYVGFCTPKGWGREEGNFSICIADKIEGPWSRTIFPEFLYDPGLFFDDDGKIYVAHGQHTLYISELSSDAKSVKVQAKKIYENKDYPYLEGSHLYKINDKYYLLGTTGGTTGRQVCLRSDNIYGPYESKVIINDNNSYPPNGLHQGGMVQLKNGDWWFIIMQDRGPIGRVPHLLPVRWEDGWPMLGAANKDVITYTKPDIANQQKISAPASSDEFNSSILGLQWQWNHNPDPSKWSLKENKGYMRLKASYADSLKNARNTLTQRVQGPNSEGTVEIDLKGLKDGNITGLAIFQFPYAYVGVQQINGKRNVIMYNDKDKKIVETIFDFKGDKIWIRARVTDRDFIAKFYYSFSGKEYYRIGNDFEMGLGLYWTANRFALFNFSTLSDGVGGYSDFNSFYFTNK
ncbi:glycoside hydrolase family 43 protein [Sphingobacterium spiritivorum]|uniref:glycoside hydrolase family 43 protein n=1 Tax=Sphingobacterium spiritivorum TaxID=258 RepID=UPI003DA422C4